MCRGQVRVNNVQNSIYLSTLRTLEVVKNPRGAMIEAHAKLVVCTANSFDFTLMMWKDLGPNHNINEHRMKAHQLF